VVRIATIDLDHVIRKYQRDWQNQKWLKTDGQDIRTRTQIHLQRGGTPNSITFRRFLSRDEESVGRKRHPTVPRARTSRGIHVDNRGSKNLIWIAQTSRSQQSK